MKEVTDRMPLFNTDLAMKIAQKQVDMAAKTTAESIHGKMNLEGAMDIVACVKFAKTQKKDGIYK